MTFEKMSAYGKLAAAARWGTLNHRARQKLKELGMEFREGFKRPLEDRFWEKVRRGNAESCWSWTAYRHYKGYGVFSVNGRPEKAHRVAYEIAFGPIPKGMCVCHRCDNPPCQNPAHLFLGTTGDNTRDSVTKGRFVSTKQGEGHAEHKLTNEIVLKARRLHKSGMAMRALSRMFPIVTRCTLRAAILGKTWKSVV